MYLRGECLKTFLAGGLYEYQQRVITRNLFNIYNLAFALGEDEMGNQACGWVDATHVGTTDPDQLAAMAIARCNESGARWGINCKLFALDNEIVWGQEEDVEFQ